VRLLEEIDDGIWNVYFGLLKVGRLLERHLRIEDAYGRLKRRTVSPMSPDSFITYLPDRSFESDLWPSVATKSLHSAPSSPITSSRQAA